MQFKRIAFNTSWRECADRMTFTSYEITRLNPYYTHPIRSVTYFQIICNIENVFPKFQLHILLIYNNWSVRNHDCIQHAVDETLQSYSRHFVYSHRFVCTCYARPHNGNKYKLHAVASMVASDSPSHSLSRVDSHSFWYISKYSRVCYIDLQFVYWLWAAFWTGNMVRCSLSSSTAVQFIHIQ